MTHLPSQRTAWMWHANPPLVAIAIAVGAVLASCSAGAGEDEASCAGRLDGDGDSVRGCDDPDCHRFELCRGAFALGGDDGGTAGSSAGSGGSSGTGGSNGGGSSGGVVETGGSGGREPIEDGGAEPDASECSCDPSEVCSDGECLPMPPPEQRYIIGIESAESPVGTFGPPPHGTCVESACLGTGSPLGYCPCEPEPYVRVVLIASPSSLDPGESIVLSTKVQGTTLSVMYGDTERVEVSLRAGDRLRFELWDENMIAEDTFIYDCEPEIGDLSELVSKPLECSVMSGALNTDVFWIRGSLTAL